MRKRWISNPTDPKVSQFNKEPQEQRYRYTSKNEYTINGAQSFSQELSTLPSLEEDEEDVSYGAGSLSTNIPVRETTDYIIDQVYVQSIFKRLLLKLATECKFTFSNSFYLQTDECATIK